MLLNNEWVKNEIREEIKKFLETNKNELTTGIPEGKEEEQRIENLFEKVMMKNFVKGHRKGSPQREVYSNTGLPKKNRNSSNKQPNHTPTRT